MVGKVTYCVSEESAASFDGALGGPFCDFYSSQCSSVNLLNGRGYMEGGYESNQPNTIDGCADGSYGLYREDESIDKIVVRSGGIDGSGSGSDLEAGKLATIVATVYVYNNGSENFADFYCTHNAYAPNWVFLGTVQPTQGGLQDLMMEYTVPDGDIQAVSVSLRNMGDATNCNYGGYNERDDLAFAVVSSTEPSDQPSSEPSSFPSGNPTVSPSKSPSSSPSQSPSASPSKSPTANPSTGPSSSPTYSPSSSPTISPLFSVQTLARTIRIESATGEPLQLYEVQVLSSETNVALGGAASQSSDYGIDYVASNAIDGNSSSFSLTKGSDAYWEVDLAGVYAIESVVIINSYTDPNARKLVDSSYSGLESLDIDDITCRLTNATVSVVDELGFVISSQSVSSACSQSSVSLSFNLTTTFSRVSGEPGWCLDSFGHYYSYVRQDVWSNSTASECGAWCMQHPSSLIGFDFYNDPSNEGNECYCLFSGDIPDSIGTYEPQYAKVSLGEMGVGPITSVSGDSNMFCYRNDVSNKMMCLSQVPTA